MAGYAFVLGLLLFVLVWLGARERAAAPAAQPVQPAAAQPAFDPLPGPAPAGAATPLPAYDTGARLVEEPAPAPPPMPGDAAPVLPPSIEPVPATPVAVQPARRLPDQPPPRYPAGALRRGESGTVVVQVEVGTDGHPASIRIERNSGSRDLDRAAVEAVARWRFEPARDAAGQPVPGSVSVPIDFKAQ
ncbi:energy transducer TonB [Pseudoxanthomonas broegbernensis]|uniref:Energy transducer TonB n=2 Tax=Pseudoxanthomonas broegbernensis TaxID=83619 RepID=A0A7V8GQG4_9GAMM|nr:energy transducer TonB [Pseudoxanthomonas broegbernensis]